MTDSSQFADGAHRYRLDERIATGGMGVVWKATDTRLNRVVAVKVLKHEYADDTTFRTRFETEARHAAALHHPGICGVFDYSANAAAAEGAPYLVMEYVDGQPLSTLLSQAKESGRAMDPEVVRDLMAQTADALAVAHEAGIVHRDIKPANLLVTPDRRVKVTDFGIARAGDATAITRTGAVMGTPQYLSPEQARGNPSSPASDVYSLGCVAYECLANRRPFEAETPVATLLAHLQQPVPQLPASVPGDLARVVTRALAKNPADRFADGAAFASALRNPSGVTAAPAAVAGADDSTAVLPQTSVLPGAAAAAAVGAGAAAPAEPMQRLDTAEPYAGEDARDRRPWAAVALVAALVVIAAIIAFLLLHGNGDDTTPTVQNTPAHRHHRSSPPTTPTTSATPTAMVTVNPDDYIGRDFHQVSDELSAMGLHVTLNQIDNPGSGTPDAVTSVRPAGAIPAGSTVTVSYYGQAPPPTTSSAPPPPPPATSSSAAAPTITPPSNPTQGGSTG